jgi:hypothetical protein
MKKILFLILLPLFSFGQDIVQDSVLSNQCHIVLTKQSLPDNGGITSYMSVNIETGVTAEWIKCNVSVYNESQILLLTKVLYITGKKVELFWRNGMEYAYRFACESLYLSY